MCLVALVIIIGFEFLFSFDVQFITVFFVNLLIFSSTAKLIFLIPQVINKAPYQLQYVTLFTNVHQYAFLSFSIMI